jgi:hypothetical protein
VIFLPPDFVLEEKRLRWQLKGCQFFRLHKLNMRVSILVTLVFPLPARRGKESEKFSLILNCASSGFVLVFFYQSQSSFF